MSETSNKGETEILYVTHHWSILLPAIIWIIVGLITAVILIGFVFIVIGVIQLILRAIAMKTNYLKLTNKRVYIKSGLLSKTERDFRLDKLDNATVNKPFLQNLLKCGTVVVRSTGAQALPMQYVEEPDKIRQAIADAADAYTQ